MNNEHNRCGNEKRRWRRCGCEIVELDRCSNVEERDGQEQKHKKREAAKGQ